ncbi:sporulation protein YqfD [Bacillus alveayuensis]|uniref:sporulation protein YqfD n=1 Tax=Aeribacillus alveayuensis TaxID=279215 RepID=UPI0005D12B0C|nr:sporulation protein YqfD [Bacillus alveayuensis]
MKNNWIYFFTGTVQVSLTGLGIERFINECIRQGIIIWNVKRHQSGGISFFIRLSDVHALRKIVKKYECKCSFQKRMGAPFWLKRSYKNVGFVIGIGIFFIITFILSNMIWGIEIKGAEPKTEHLIEKELSKIGLKKGALQFLLPESEQIQAHVMKNVEQISWIGIDLVGTTYYIEVVEKSEPPKMEVSSPRHIVAKKEAVIAKMFVEKGQPMVSINDHVAKGQILVSGLIGDEEHQRLVSAKGEIYGETWYVTTVQVPITSTLQVLTGNRLIKHKLQMGSITLPIWGFQHVEYEQFQKEQTIKPFRFLKWTLPIAYKKEIYYEEEAVTKKYNEKEAKEKGIEIAKKKLKNQLGKRDQIMDEKVLHVMRENGKVKLKILFQVMEDIVETKPIVQGD